MNIGDESFFAADGSQIIIGDKTSINTIVHVNSSIGGMIKISKLCLIGPGVVMRTSQCRFNEPYLPIRQQGHAVGDIFIDDNVWIGGQAVILSGIRIQSGTEISAGDIINKYIPAMAVPMSIPAKVINIRKT